MLTSDSAGSAVSLLGAKGAAGVAEARGLAGAAFSLFSDVLFLRGRPRTPVDEPFTTEVVAGVLGVTDADADAFLVFFEAVLAILDSEESGTMRMVAVRRGLWVFFFLII